MTFRKSELTQQMPLTADPRISILWPFVQAMHAACSNNYASGMYQLLRVSCGAGHTLLLTTETSYASDSILAHVLAMSLELVHSYHSGFCVWGL
jgi:hypothetical protein